jgi:acyl-coenzyme A thioesterase PaaI-like protein
MRHAPVERGLGMVPAAGEGFALRAPLHDRVRDDDGVLVPALVALLADSGIGFLIFTAGELRAGAPTVDLRIDHLGPSAPDATEVRAEFTLLHLDGQVGVGRADLCDDTGRPLAHAVATMAMTGVPDRPGALAGETGADGADFRAGRPPFDAARLDPANLELDGDTAVFTPGPSTTNLNGTTHGAVLAALAKAAQTRFLTGDGHGVRPLSDTVDYLRPVPVDTRVRVRCETVRSGRRFWTVRTELLLPDDRVAVRATGNGLW